MPLIYIICTYVHIYVYMYLSTNHSFLTTKYISTSFSKILQTWTNLCTFNKHERALKYFPSTVQYKYILMCMYVHNYTLVHTCTHMHKHTDTYNTDAHTHMDTRMCARTHSHGHMHVRTHTHTYRDMPMVQTKAI